MMRGIKLLSVLALSSGTAAAYLASSGNETFYGSAVLPCLHRLDAEKAHNIGIKMASYGLSPRYAERIEDAELLKTRVWNVNFKNPVGLAAGFDKNAECIDGMLKMGFGFVEVGSVTPKAQAGNPKPRIFRLPEDGAVINRCGFNNGGIEAVKQKLKSREQDKRREEGILGISVGKNKTTVDGASDFVKGVEELGTFADYLVINVSSPNTPGLRRMQGREQLTDLIGKVLCARNELQNKPPLLVKIAPDLSDQDKEDIAVVVTSSKCHVDGIVVSNTTVQRPASLKSANKCEIGGLSGEPLKEASTAMVHDMYQRTKGTIPIIGVGGISSGKDAYDKITAGASLVQFYSAMVYGGPPIVRRIKMELADLLRKDGYKNVAEAVGTAHQDGNAKK